ncbi:MULTISPECIES: type II and III secretion system protein family protein [unclassified Mesorhizobium]|uniref:type II and III secretion system protein family protein n=1 Tax=unclassified Mesorhizobium TaxID=325217 RepID=UPI000FCB9255|nr:MULTISPECIES: type II and III secretion system protein family protein [unclassified Mesorhizobium]RUU62718.1 type II and III secretion system protein family protein [Mesorhizobium sp. M7A.T.Ca.TU.009.01.1.1]RUT88595.1 type II and III secretion system protein family protein [Mesorhizobium sp. M7A.T.Ca.US.000.02.1.1]RUU77572.1 type II and III secretion system protein family protein [Mesorhizobium sp. M7A.F.Ca.MR.362.00.0.0]RUV21707.1 type II and III secretion system protein family protein [Mes
MFGLFTYRVMGRLRILRAVAVASSLAAAAMLAFGASARADNDIVYVSSTKNASIKVAKGKPKTIMTSAAFYQIVIGDPEIANVNPLTDKSFYVLGNNLGTTGIALFDEKKQLVGTVDIEVTLDTDQLASTIRASVPDARIKVGSANGRVVLSGEADDAVAAEKANKIATRFSGTEEVINSVNISSSQQVQLNVRFVEINRQAGQDLGAKYAANFAYGLGGRDVSIDPGTVPAAGTGEIIGRLLSNGVSIDIAIKALEERGLARRLAEPNLIARSGQTASFLAGGEFPIPVSEDDGKISVSYKKYGVSLDFTPTVLKDGLVSLDIAPEVSSIDASASYNIGTISVPGFIVRRARTSVDLKNGQSFMIAGLLQSQNDITTSRIPGLGKMPVLGALFSSKSYQRRETDLVIIVTPYLVKPVDPSKKLVEPTDGTQPASNADYFLNNTEEVKDSDAGRTVALADGRVTQPAAAASAGHFLDLPKD